MGDMLFNTEILKKIYVEKCLTLEESLEKEKKEKEEYYNIVVNNNIKKARERLTNKDMNQRLNEDKIEDLLQLANKELDLKSQKISELTNRLEDLELKNLKKFNKNKLNELKTFFSDGLGRVI